MPGYGWNPKYWEVTDWCLFLLLVVGALSVVGLPFAILVIDDIWGSSQIKRMKIVRARTIGSLPVFRLEGPLGHFEVVYSKGCLVTPHGTVVDLVELKIRVQNALPLYEAGVIGSAPGSLQSMVEKKEK